MVFCPLLRNDLQLILLVLEFFRQVWTSSKHQNTQQLNLIFFISQMKYWTYLCAAKSGSHFLKVPSTFWGYFIKYLLLQPTMYRYFINSRLPPKVMYYSNLSFLPQVLGQLYHKTQISWGIYLTCSLLLLSIRSGIFP